jgi:hypothetical protein
MCKLKLQAATRNSLNIQWHLQKHVIIFKINRRFLQEQTVRKVWGWRGKNSQTKTLTRHYYDPRIMDVLRYIRVHHYHITEKHVEYVKKFNFSDGWAGSEHENLLTNYIREMKVIC